MARTRTIADEDLLSAARALFVQRGAAASTKDIARRAGVSEGVLFQRFRTKEELFFAAMALPAADLARLMREGRGTGLAGLQRLARAMTGYFRASMPVLVPLLAHPGFEFEAFARRHPDAPLDVLRREVVRFFAGERQAGRIGPADPGAAALVVFSVAQSVAFFERMGAHGGRMPDAIVDAANLVSLTLNVKESHDDP